MKRIYFDNAASTVLDKKVRKLLCWYAKQPLHGNPSSLHLEGRRERQLVEWARKRCAQELGCSSEEIFFTSGASESNSWAQKIWRLHTYKTHDSFGEGYDTDVYAVSGLNNETGHEDYIDMLNLPDGMPDIFIDLTATIGHKTIHLHDHPEIIGASLSGHKFGALQGVGLMYIRQDQQEKACKKNLVMGHQEQGLRGGTENVLGILSLAIALTETQKRLINREDKIDQMVAAIYFGACSLGLGSQRNEHIVNITFKHLNAQTAVLIFNQYGIAISAGSACNSTSDEPSEILLAEGYKFKEALRTIRISLGYQNTFKEVRKFQRVLRQIVDKYDDM